MKLIDKKDFAELAGVSRPAVSRFFRAPKDGKAAGKLYAAVFEGKVDIHHPAAMEYLENNKNKEYPRKPVETSSSKKSADKDADTPIDFSELSGMSVEQISKEFGTTGKLNVALAAAKDIALIEKINIQNQKSRGQLVEREMIEKHIIGYIATFQHKILSDVPRRVALTIADLKEAGATPEKMEQSVLDIISNQMKQIKENAVTALSHV